MPELSPTSAEALKDMTPVLEQMVQFAPDNANADLLDQGIVTSVDPASGRCTVTLDTGAVDGPADCASVLPAVGERVWVMFVPPSGYLVIGRHAGIPMLGGWGETSSDVALDETAASVIVTAECVIQPERLVTITGHCGSILDTSGATQFVEIYVDDFTDGTAVPIGRLAKSLLVAGNDLALGGTLTISDATDGYHLYRLMGLTTDGPATAQSTATGTLPGLSTLLVQDVGSVNLPSSPV